MSLDVDNGALDRLAGRIAGRGAVVGVVGLGYVGLPLAVAIARAVVMRPALLVADEPTGNLDVPQARRVLSLLQEMHRMGTTVVVATHAEGLVAEYPAPALRLAEGRLVSHG